jgi:hypothetical protein
LGGGPRIPSGEHEAGDIHRNAISFFFIAQKVSDG